MDTFARAPASSLIRLHMDPEGPTPSVSATSTLAELPEAAIDTVLTVAGPGSGSTLLAAELRQLGGALSRPAPGGGALRCMPGQFLMYGVAVAPDAEAARRGQADADRLADALSPWSNGWPYLNFTEQAVDMSTAFSAEAWACLRALRAAVDPAGILRANHPIR
jgi:hypothetical protein